MISFFRKIRRQSLLNNRITRYLTYAVGEIVLIVIGIFIALQINNWNEARKNTKEVYAQLAQVHEDLTVTLEICDMAAAVYGTKDDAIRDILYGKTTVEDYKDPERREHYMSAASIAFVPNFQTSGFTELVSNGKAVPEELLPLLEDLKKIFNMRLAGVRKDQEYVHEILDTKSDWALKNLPWYIESYFDNSNEPLSEERIAYYLSDPNYKKFVNATYVAAIGNHYGKIVLLRNSAVESYEELSKLLGLEEGEDLSCNLDPEDFQQLTGTYLVEESSGKLGYEKASLYIEGDRLMLATHSPEDTPSRLFPLRERSWWLLSLPMSKMPAFTDLSGLFYYADVAGDGSVTGLKARIGSKFITYTKIE
jgi:hypothetical protein